MRVMLVAAAVLVAGCATGVARLDESDACTVESFDEGGEDGFDRGVILSCEDLVGEGAWSIRMPCDDGGLAGAELEGGHRAGTLHVSFAGGAGAFSRTITGSEEAWHPFGAGNGTVAVAVRTSPDYDGDVAAGLVCFGPATAEA